MPSANDEPLQLLGLLLGILLPDLQAVYLSPMMIVRATAPQLIR